MEDNDHEERLLPDLLGRCMFPMAVVEGATSLLRYVNPAFCDLVGRPSEVLIGKPFAETVPEAEREACLALLNRVYQTGKAETYTKPELEEPYPDSRSCIMWPVLGGDERPSGVLIQVNETTLFHQRASAMNQSLLLSGIRQHELTEVAEEQNARLQVEIAERKRAEEALQKALNEVRTLRGILPICANCKMIRDDQGYWSQVEVYIRDHSEVEFSHGICPECIKKIYPGLDHKE